MKQNENANHRRERLKKKIISQHSHCSIHHHHHLVSMIISLELSSLLLCGVGRKELTKVRRNDTRSFSPFPGYPELLLLARTKLHILHFSLESLHSPVPPRDSRERSLILWVMSSSLSSLQERERWNAADLRDDFRPSLSPVRRNMKYDERQRQSRRRESRCTRDKRDHGRENQTGMTKLSSNDKDGRESRNGEIYTENF